MAKPTSLERAVAEQNKVARKIAPAANPAKPGEVQTVAAGLDAVIVDKNDMIPLDDVRRDIAKQAGKRGALAKKQKTDKFWKPWEARFRQLLSQGLKEHKARLVIEKEMNPSGKKRLRSLSAITARLKK